MSKVSIEGNASGTGTLTIAAPNTNSNYTLTLPSETGTLVTTGITSGLNASALTTGTVNSDRLPTVPVSKGGTGATTLTANNVILGNGTSAVGFVAPGSSGNVLTSNGTTWASTAPASSAPTTQQVLDAYAGASEGGVGTYAFAWRNTAGNATFGSTIAGSSLRAFGFHWTSSPGANNSIDGVLSGSGSLSGTWRCMGQASANSGYYAAMIWLRIS
jgi:hypothetical protein